jgi:glyoxylase-like metal-dependent hydrolase (beta-lactamase superfamily II)
MSKLQIAERWFDRKKIDSALTLLWEPFVHPLLRCNIWHLRGRDADLLIDTGLGIASLKNEIADLLEKPLVAVATHVHYDHVGGLHEFPQRLMHPLEAPRMARYREFARLDRAALPADLITVMADAGQPIDGEFLISAVPDAGYDPLRYRIHDAPVTRTIADGDVVDIGDRHFEVMHLPGHSPGSIGLWEAATGVLFSGDAIYDGALLDDLPGSDRGDYVRTMKRLLQLPVTVVHGGHEPSFGRERLREIALAYLAARDG